MLAMAHHDGMKMSSIINWDCCGVQILFKAWTIQNCTQFTLTLVALFIITMTGELIGAYKHPLASKCAFKPYLMTPLLLLLGWTKTLIGALMMLVMMTFNGYIILTITAASALSRTVCTKSISLDDQEGILCH